MCQYRKGDLHMTKTQLRSRLRKLLDKLGDVRAELYDLRDEVEETKDNIEPYEGYDDLTPEQEEQLNINLKNLATIKDKKNRV